MMSKSPFLIRWMPVLLALAGLVEPEAWATVQPHALIADGMVLQQGQAVPIWGKAAAGESVTVTFAGQTKTAVTAADGTWKVVLASLVPGGPFPMTIAGTNTITYSNVYVGEVWVCSGQSNMAFALQDSDNAASAIAAAQNSKIRLFTVPMAGSTSPQYGLANAAGTATPPVWKECTPANASVFSAVAYYFGRDLQAARGVPVGLIHASLGGTPAEAWTRREALEAHPDLKPYADRYPRGSAFSNQLDYTSAWFNGMIAPLMPYGIKGVVWYQGESNTGAPGTAQAYLYRILFQVLIKNWRDDWQQGNFPFLFTQLAPYDPGAGIAPVFAENRDSQFYVNRKVPAVGMAVISDTVPAASATNIHPTNKAPVGQRLALAARAVAYGESLVAFGPLYDTIAVEGGSIRLRFKNTGGGLMAQGGGALQGFTIAGADQNFVAATAAVQGSEVIVSAAGVPSPVAVRYGWANYPVVNLFNSNGLPASPFRTDSFTLITQPAFVNGPVDIAYAATTNTAPVANAGSDFTVTLPKSASLSGSASDDGLPSGSTLAYTWSKVSGGGTVTFGNASAAATTATFSAAGTYVLLLTASDGALSGSDDVQVTVSPAAVNQAPVVNAGSALAVTLPNTASLSGSASDDGLPSGSTLTYRWSKVSGTGTVTFGNASAAATTATFSAAGTYVLLLTASDGALSGSDDVQVTVNPAAAVNHAPVVNAGSALAVTLPNTASLSGSASDDGLPAGSALAYAWTKISGVGTVVFSAPAAAQTTASFSVAGAYVLNLTASDGALSGSGNVSVQVNPNPDGDGDGMLDTWETAHGLNPLSAADAALDADSDGLNNLQEYQTSTDPQKADTDGDGMPDGWEVVHHLSALTASAAGDADNDGLSNLQEYQRGIDPELADTDKDGLPDKFEVEHGLSPLADNSNTDTDHDGVSDVQEYQLGQEPTVAAPPMPPETQCSGAARTGSAVTLEAVSGHGGGVVITSVAWTLLSQPGGGWLIAASSSGAASLQIGLKGDYVLEATATDANGMKSSTVVHVQAYDAGNLPPVADAGPDVYGDVGKAVELYGLNSSDSEDGANLTYRWKLLRRPGNAAADLSVADQAIGRFTPDQPGIYVFALSVWDSSSQPSVSLDPGAPGAAGLPGDATVYVEVRGGTGHTPRAQVVKEEITAAAGTPVKLDATGSSDLDGSALSYAWEFVSRPAGSQAALNDVTAAAPALTPDISGTYKIRLTVKDGEGHTDARTLTVYAAGAGAHPPVTKAGAIQKLMAGAGDLPVQLDGGQTTDADGDILTYRWTQLEGPAVELLNATSLSPTFVIPASRPRRAGVYRFRLEVRDAFGFANAATTAVLVNTAGEHVPELKAFSFPPLAGGGASQRIATGKEARIAVQVDAAGDSGEKLRVFWTQASGPAALFRFDSASADDGVENEILVIQAKQAGTYTFKIYVDDGKPRGLEQELTFEADAAAVALEGTAAGPSTAASGATSTPSASSTVSDAVAKNLAPSSAGGGCFLGF